MTDILDGRYTGPLTPEQVIEQFDYRIGIHLSYRDKLEDGDRNYLLGLPDIPTAIAFHNWAINGYEEGIKHIKENNPIREVCTLPEAVNTLFGAIIKIFRRR